MPEKIDNIIFLQQSCTCVILPLLQGQFNSDREVKLKNDKTKEEALRRNTYFAAFKKDNTNTSANISAVSND